jgi:HAD superfamily hydrolase (TIGR01549 family)
VKPKGYLLDFDNTLYDYDSAHRPAMDAVMARFAGVSDVAEDVLLRAYVDSRDEIHQRLAGTAASHNRLLYFQGMCERLGIHPIPLALESLELYWNVYNDSIRLDDGVGEFFVNRNGAPVAIVTDLTADVQYRKIIRVGLECDIDFLVTSEEVGQEKPSSAMFARALAKLNLRADQVLMVGDHYERDILGAVALGIRSFWLNRTGDHRPAHPLVTQLSLFKDILNYS